MGLERPVSLSLTGCFVEGLFIRCLFQGHECESRKSRSQEIRDSIFPTQPAKEGEFQCMSSINKMWKWPWHHPFPKQINTRSENAKSKKFWHSVSSSDNGRINKVAHKWRTSEGSFFSAIEFSSFQLRIPAAKYLGNDQWGVIVLNEISFWGLCLFQEFQLQSFHSPCFQN